MEREENEERKKERGREMGGERRRRWRWKENKSQRAWFFVYFDGALWHNEGEIPT